MDLSGEDLQGRDFSEMDLDGANFSRANLAAVQFRKASLKGANFSSARLTDASFAEATASRADFRHATFGVHLYNLKAPQADFSFAIMNGVQLLGADLTGATFQKTNLSNSFLIGSILKSADLSEAILASCKLERCDLSNADLRGADLHAADLAGANVEHTKIRRLDIEDLRLENLAGLHPSQLHDMDIEDGFGELRRYFSGFWTFIHLVSVTIWLLPLAWIIARSVTLSITPPSIGVHLFSLTLLEQLWGYWKSGRVAPLQSYGLLLYPFNCLFFVTWALVLIYNAARLALVFKVKLWEHQQTITGLHPDVTVKGWVKTTFKAVAVLFYVNLFIIAFHFIHFLRTSFPILPSP